MLDESRPRGAEEEIEMSEVITTWQRTEGNRNRCPCGTGSETWELLSGGKRVASATFCPRCDPKLANLVSRSKPLGPKHAAAQRTWDGSVRSEARRARRAADQGKSLEA